MLTFHQKCIPTVTCIFGTQVLPPPDVLFLPLGPGVQPLVTLCVFHCPVLKCLLVVPSRLFHCVCGRKGPGFPRDRPRLGPAQVCSHLHIHLKHESPSMILESEG